MTQPRDTPRRHTRGQFPLLAAHRRLRGFRRILLLQVNIVFTPSARELEALADNRDTALL